MKKSLQVFLAIALIILALLVVDFGVDYFGKIKVTDFNVEDYQEYIDYYNEFGLGDENAKETVYLGAISDAGAARQKALEYLQSIYDCAKDEKPYTCKYDRQHEVWLVSGNMSYLPPIIRSGKKGGTAELLVQASDGEVLAVWHGK